MEKKHMRHLSKKERYRLNMDALFGTDISQDRLINERHHKKRKNILNVVIILIIAIAIAGNLIISMYSNKGYVLAFGTKMDNSTFFGIITTEEIKAEQDKEYEELTYNNLTVSDLFLAGNIPFSVILIMILIALFDKRADSARALKAKKEYDRKAAIIAQEELEKQRKRTKERHDNAPDIIEESDIEN